MLVLRRNLSSTVLHVEYELTGVLREPLITLLDNLAEWVVHMIQAKCQRILQCLNMQQRIARTNDVFNAGVASFIQA